MDNKILAEMIKEKYYEEKMSAEYKLQLNKVVELEDKFLKDFSKVKWKEYLYLDIEKGQLHSIEVDQEYYFFSIVFPVLTFTIRCGSLIIERL